MENMRYVITDIHGCCRTFRALLEKIHLKNTDELFLLGDYIDRGPDSKGVLDTVMNLDCRVLALKGNHEDLWLKTADSEMDRAKFFHYNYWMENGILARLHSFEGTDPAPYLAFLKGLPLYHELEDYLLVHGEFDFSLADPFGEMGEESMLWGRGKSHTGAKPVICGHTPLRLDKIKAALGTNQINIDNGCCFRQDGYGHLLAYCIDDGYLHIQPNIDDYTIRRPIS
jgi:serine/threonine protein phosphatase 1